MSNEKNKPCDPYTSSPTLNMVVGEMGALAVTRMSMLHAPRVKLF